jgi:hypothetical protein
MNAKTAVGIATVYLIIYTALAIADYAYPVIATLYLVSPLLILGMVYFVLKDNHCSYPELAEGEEWSYRDRSKDTLGLF